MSPGRDDSPCFQGARPANSRLERCGDDRAAVAGGGVGVGFGSRVQAERNREPAQTPPCRYASKRSVPSMWRASAASAPTPGSDPVSRGCSGGRRASDRRPAAFSRCHTTIRGRRRRTGREPTPAWNCAPARIPLPGIELGPVGGGRYAVDRLVVRTTGLRRRTAGCSGSGWREAARRQSLSGYSRVSGIFSLLRKQNGSQIRAIQTSIALYSW